MQVSGSRHGAELAPRRALGVIFAQASVTELVLEHGKVRGHLTCHFIVRSARPH
jgi:hypothetical protein